MTGAKSGGDLRPLHSLHVQVKYLHVFRLLALGQHIGHKLLEFDLQFLLFKTVKPAP